MHINFNSIMPFKQNYDFNNKKVYNSYPNLALLQQDTVSFGAKSNKIEDIQNKAQNIENQIGKPINEATNEELFNALGMLKKRDDDGLLVLSRYGQPNKTVNWKDIGVNENELFKNVKSIDGNANFTRSYINDLGQLQNIEGTLIKPHAIGKRTLQTLKDTLIKNTEKQIGKPINEATNEELFNFFGIHAKRDDDGLLILDNYRKPYKIPNWEIIGVNENELFKDVKEIRGNVDLFSSNATDFGKLQKIGGEILGENSQIQALKKTLIKNIENQIDKPIYEATSEELFNAFGMLEKKDDDGLLILKEYKQPYNNNALSFLNMGINENELFKDVKEIKGNANFEMSEIKNLGKLQSIGGNANLSSIKDFGQLETIGGYANFNNVRKYIPPKSREYSNDKFEEIKINNLRKIGGNVNFCEARNLVFDNLEEIGGNLYLGDARGISLRNLKKIDGYVWTNSRSSFYYPKDTIITKEFIDFPNRKSEAAYWTEKKVQDLKPGPHYHGQTLFHWNLNAPYDDSMA